MDDQCEECGFDGQAMSIDALIAALRLLPDQVTATVAPATDEQLRTRPPAGAWSAMEYLGHLRDLMAYHRWLIEQAVAEDSPVLAAADPDSAVESSGYRQGNRDELLSQFARRVDRLSALLESLSPSALARPLILDRPIDVQLVARSALHEGVHHRGDLARLVNSN